jgi:hypothetical protein
LFADGAPCRAATSPVATRAPPPTPAATFRRLGSGRSPSVRATTGHRPQAPQSQRGRLRLWRSAAAEPCAPRTVPDARRSAPTASRAGAGAGADGDGSVPSEAAGAQLLSLQWGGRGLQGAPRAAQHLLRRRVLRSVCAARRLRHMDPPAHDGHEQLLPEEPAARRTSPQPNCVQSHFGRDAAAPSATSAATPARPHPAARWHQPS